MNTGGKDRMTSPPQQPGEDGSERQPEDRPSPESSETESGAGQPEPEQPEGAGDVPAPKRKRTGLVIGAVAAAVVILGGGAALIFAFTGGDSARTVAEKYVAVSTKETQRPASVTAADYRPLICGKSMPQIEQVQKQKEQFLKTAKPEQLEMIKKVRNTVKDVRTDGDSGTVTLETAAPGTPPQTAQLNLVKEGGDWKLCG